MGASASRRRSSPSLPVSSTLTETRSTTTDITVDGYSRDGLVPVGSPLVYEVALLDVTYRIEIYPSGFNQHTADCIAVFAGRTGESSIYFPRHRRPAARFFFEILYGSAAHQRTVFDNFTALSSETTWVSQAKGIFRAFESKEPGRVEEFIRSRFNRKEASHMTGFIRFVKRKELEASGCIRNDSFTIRCTISVDVRVTKSWPGPGARKGLSAHASPPVLSWSHMLLMDSLSELKATLRAGECVHSTQFTLAGSCWFFKLYPNGHCNENMDMSIFLGRGMSQQPSTTAEFSFEIPGLMVGRPFTKCMFDRDNPLHEFPCIFRAMNGDNDRLVVWCHLRVIKVTRPGCPDD